MFVAGTKFMGGTSVSGTMWRQFPILASGNLYLERSEPYALRYDHVQQGNEENYDETYTCVEKEITTPP